MNFSVDGNDTTFAYFGPDSSYSSANAALVVTWALCQFAGSPMLLGIVHYYFSGGPPTYQTVVNRLTAHAYLLLLSYTATAFNLYLVRGLWGPLTRGWCIFQFVACVSVVCAILLTVSEIIALRYLYTFVWKNIGSIHDDVFLRFFAVMNAVAASLYGAVTVLFGDHDGSHQAYCQGSHPYDPEMVEQPHFMAVPLVACTAFCTAVSGYMSYKSKTTSAPEAEAASVATTGNAVAAWRYKLVDIFVGLGAVVFYLPSAAVWFCVEHRRLDALPPWFVVSGFLSPQVFALVLIPFSQYVKSPGLRRHVARCLGETGGAPVRALARCCCCLSANGVVGPAAAGQEHMQMHQVIG